MLRILSIGRFIELWHRLASGAFYSQAWVLVAISWLEPNCFTMQNSNPDHETPRYCGRPLPASVRTVTNINSNTGHETFRCCGRPLPASVRTVTNINSSTGHETLRYCGRPLPPPRLAFVILLKVVPVPLGPPIPQSPARKHCTGAPHA